MGRTEGKNGSFMAIRDENPSKFFFFHDPLVDLKKKKKSGARGYAQISDRYVMYLLCYSIAVHSFGALMYLKT